jgi:hypothetical protein
LVGQFQHHHPQPTPPTAPTVGVATAGNASASVAFTPGSMGSGTLVNYTAQCGSSTANGSASPITVAGLTNGTAVTCKVKTTSTVGTGPWSGNSNSVTPKAPEPPVTYFHNDIAGSPLLATDANGNVELELPL